MANEEHLAILNKGVKEWNEWRKSHPHVKVDLSSARLDRANLSRVDFQHASLRSACMTLAIVQDANLAGADLQHAVLRRAILQKSNLVNANLKNAVLEQADLLGADCSSADLTEANLMGASLFGAQFQGAVLTRADLRLVSASMTFLQGVNLTGANLRGAVFSSALLEQADLSKSMMALTQFSGVDLRSVKGLETVLHNGPSTVGIDTIYQSKGNIPESFLRGAGVPGPFIANMKALVAAMEPIQFYSCFISYSSKDQEFVDRLYVDLQQKNVRCWFAPEDLKIGDKFRTKIDEAIRLHDKLLLVLTESSVKSAWVEKEVETAFEKERRQGRTVLFPIRLDDAVMEAEEAWAADIRRTRHIGDFCGWKEHDKYKTAFERLMRDLKAEEKGGK